MLISRVQNELNLENVEPLYLKPIASKMVHRCIQVAAHVSKTFLLINRKHGTTFNMGREDLILNSVMINWSHPLVKIH